MLFWSRQQNPEIITPTMTTTTTTPTKQKKKHKNTETPEKNAVGTNVTPNPNNNNAGLNVSENKGSVPSPSKGKNSVHILPRAAKNAANSPNPPTNITDSSSSISSPLEVKQQELVVPSEDTESSSSIRGELKKIENNLAAKMERLMQQQVDKMFARFEKERLDREKAEKERLERLVAAISQSISSSLAPAIQTQVEKVFKKEMQGVMPVLGRAIATSVENSMGHVKKSLAASSSKMETFAKESLDKMTAIASTQNQARQPNLEIRDTVERTVQQSFISVFQENLLPAFEGASQAMLRQMHASLDKSTKDATQQLVQHVQQQVKAPTVIASPVDNLLTEQLRSAVQTLSDISNSLQSTIISTQSKLVEELMVQRSNPSTPHYNPGTPTLSNALVTIPPQRSQSVEQSFPPPPVNYNMPSHLNSTVSRSPSSSSNSLPAVLQHLAGAPQYPNTTHSPVLPPSYSHQPQQQPTRD
eukprot:TRINITY_DN9242_c0_g1_i1.p1 TRINITY_DN9242_c0_g1~~TRINITY_DN9242_c0_g1_i1.p1  ORF type:complete len:473 (+),score=117.71 TRINITY_DN9242_c0_g1_i1:56-1474(+)